jgi:3-methylcrotonyl-CoA carboxylase alpha subunit
LERIDPRRAGGAVSAEAAGSAHAPMPGVVVSLLVAPGQSVAEGEALLVIESMKLQTTVCAAIEGHVAELPFAVGQTFQRGAVLARVQPTETAT